MKNKKSRKALFSGGLGTILSLAGTSAVACCGGGSCVAICGAVCAAPLASLFGMSTIALSSWMNSLLPLFTAISGVAFTVAYYSLYNKKSNDCCIDANDNSCAPRQRSQLSKPLFWSSLIVAIGFYGYTFANSGGVLASNSCETSAACLTQDAGKISPEVSCDSSASSSECSSAESSTSDKACCSGAIEPENN